MFVRSCARALLVGTSVMVSSPAWAHVSIPAPAYAKQSAVVTFNVGHGCEGADTTKIEVSIPKEVTTIRAVPSYWGDATFVKNDADIVTSVVWSKDKARAADDQYYSFAIRITVPDAPFTTLYFPTKQTCKAADGSEKVTDWKQLPEDVKDSASEEGSPAPALKILPVRAPGWNKFTVAKDVSDLTVFNDAQIVWKGDAAYSGNPTTVEQIKSEEGVTELTELKEGDEIWVKY